MRATGLARILPVLAMLTVALVVASYVAISRLPANRHWLSDVVFGSSVGIIAGRTVTRHGREFPVTVIPTRGVALVYVRDRG